MEYYDTKYVLYIDCIKFGVYNSYPKALKVARSMIDDPKATVKTIEILRQRTMIIDRYKGNRWQNI